jgi:WD40 repeat protein
VCTQDELSDSLILHAPQSTPDPTIQACTSLANFCKPSTSTRDTSLAPPIHLPAESTTQSSSDSSPAARQNKPRGPPGTYFSFSVSRTMKAAPLLVSWHNENAPIYSAHFEPHGKGRLATAGGDNNVRLWNVETQGEERKVTYLSTLVKHTQAVNVVRWCPRGMYFLISCCSTS